MPQKKIGTMELTVGQNFSKTKTWEDLRMITKNNETMQKAAAPLYQLNSDAVARQCAQSRADAAHVIT